MVKVGVVHKESVAESFRAFLMVKKSSWESLLTRNILAKVAKWLLLSMSSLGVIDNGLGAGVV